MKVYGDNYGLFEIECTGLKKIRGSEDKDCRSSEHNPPTHIVLDAGEYEYTCPACGHVQKFTIPLITC